MWIVLYLKFKWHSYSHFMPINMLDDKFKHWQNVNHRIWLRWPKSVSIGAHCLVFFCIENDSHFFVLYSSASGSKKNEKKCLAVSTIETNRINRKKIHVCSHHDEHPHPHNSRVRLSYYYLFFTSSAQFHTGSWHAKSRSQFFSASKHEKYMMRTANMQNT